MGMLNNKVAFIAGGSGNVGEGIVRAFLNEGATVIASSRKAEKLDRLRGYLEDVATDKLVPIVGNLGEIESAEKLRDEIADKVGRLDAVVACLGSSWNKNLPLTRVSMEEWQKYLFTNLTTHFVTARTFLPVLAETNGSSYTFLGGGATTFPVPNYSVVAIPAAAQLMMAKVVMQEMENSGVRINEVIANDWVETRSSKDKAKPSWLTADDIGKYIAWLASDDAEIVNGTVPYLQKKMNPFS